MTWSLESLIEHYGYVALFLGTLLEGETILVISGFAAHRGWLSLPWVMVIAFCGSLAGDQLWFYVGRRKGSAFVAARQAWARRAERVRTLAEGRFGVVVVLGFRFLYGLRSVTPLVLGASGYDVRRFTVLNVAGAAAWSVLVGLAGYFFGRVAELVIEDVKQYEASLVAILFLAGAIAWSWRALRRHRRSPKDDVTPPMA